jgi:S-adenosylmethionine hydrolase
MSAPIVALLTDFGTRDWYAAALKGVLLARAPRARLVDITHEVPPQDVTAGAFLLAAAAPWFPAGTVFLAVVDPGVGTNRALLAIGADRRYFIGPDNGLLSLAVARARRVSAVRLTARRFWLPVVSRTFHGRDILAPVAAYLARGGSLRRLGVPSARWTSLALPPVKRLGRRLQGRIVHVDAYGNLITNIAAGRSWPPDRHRASVVTCRGRRLRVVLSYAEGRPHQALAVIGSLGFLELAVRHGSASRVLTARRGDAVTVRWA